MIELSRKLYNRGLHRSFGDASLGTISAFLTVIFLIRAAANLYFVISISAGSADINYQQISSGWFLQIAVYIILCSSLSAFHLSFALPKISFIEISGKGKLFRRYFLRQASILRPVNIVLLIFIFTGFFIFISASNDIVLFLRGIVLLISALFFSVLSFKAADRIAPGKLEIQILEACFLFLLVIINPDVISYKQQVTLLYQGQYFKFDNIFISLSIIAGAFIIHLLLLALLKALSIFNNKQLFKPKLKPFTSWYLQYFKLSYWFLLYILILPFMFLEVFSPVIKIQAFTVYTLFNIFSFVIFLNSCDNSLREKWHTKLIQKSNVRLVSHSVIIHLLLTSLPILLFLTIRT